MKLVDYVKCFLLICVVAFPIVSSAEDRAEEPLSYAVPETQFTFQSVVEGTEIVHDFLIHNKGADVLSILNVKTG